MMTSFSFIKNNKLLFVSFFWALILAISSTSKLISDISEISALRRNAVSLSERNEISGLQVETSLSEMLSSTLAKSDEEKIDKAKQTLTRLVDLKMKVETLKKEHEENVAVQKQKKQKENEEKGNNGAEEKEERGGTDHHHQQQHQQQPSMFMPQGSHLLEGNAQVFKLEQKWNYPQGSDELQLHREILGQAAVAARTLESMCAIEAWREYLDAFIKAMEKRKDTMLYNWI